MRVIDIQEALRTIGWPIEVDGIYGPITKLAVQEFQFGWAYTDDLVIDGIVGPHTTAALSVSEDLDGAASPHFLFAEFRSKGDGWIRVNRELVRRLETYRRALGRPVVIVSGYRDPDYNRAVGGVWNSMHIYGAAADVVPLMHVDNVRDLGLFAGIGYRRSDGLVIQMDVRGINGAPNYTGGTPEHPSLWTY